MKIAFIVEPFPTVSETFILNQITGLIELGHEVDIYACHVGDISKIHPDVEKYQLLEHTYYYSKGPDNYIVRMAKALIWLTANFSKHSVPLIESLNFLKYGSRAISLELFYATIILLKHKQNYDIIHCHFGPFGLKAALWRQIGAIQGKIITVFHGYDMTNYLSQNGEQAYDLLFNLGDLFLPISEHWKQRLIEIGCTGKIAVHHMGIDCQKFAFAVRKPRSDGQVNVVTVARLVEKKGIEYGIRAVAKLIASNFNIQYTIVGDGYLRKKLQRLIKQLGIADTVKLVGSQQQQEIIAILNNSHIFLAPSVTSNGGDQEGIPVALMETMAMGLPVVTTQHSGIPELVQDDISGFLVPERDVDALTEKLSYLVKHPEVWSKMGAAGRSFVEKHYNINILNNQLVEIYQNLLDDKFKERKEQHKV
ncbi:MAG TPA: glycosyltransferase [Nostoc sp.]|uniref:glycosyltransferase n=1 Tax=Nostoc sp. TaxID=1180 RepID=UPI002D3271A5|nr:glycosyltransferase [Nostoc sp.]HYX13854.1 glycosyltransferase [Nostoc sp.]